MTFVGKILVIIIMVFSILFLAISTVVFTTETNWREETKKQKEQVKKLKDQVDSSKSDVARIGDDLAKAQAAHKAELGLLNGQITNLEDQNKKTQDEITEQNKLLETALVNTKSSVQEAEQRKSETDLLRDQLKAVQAQSNDFKLRQTELNDQIRILQRELDVAKTNNKDLRERVALLSTVIRTHNLSADIDRIRRVDNPPEVEGEVAKVDSRNSRVEITIGADDGLVQGNTLHIYRTVGADAGYIGKIQLDLVDPDQATGHVVGRTIQGKKIKAGDHVTTQIRPRS